MPVLDGRETLAIIKSEGNTESIPVIVFTTSSSPHDKAFFSRFDTEMITKPHTYDGLKTIIHQLLSENIKDKAEK